MKLMARRLVWIALVVWFIPLMALLSFAFDDPDPLRNLWRSWPKPALPPEGGKTP